MKKSDFVIIGGVACGPKTAATLARRLPGATITLYQREAYLSYASCGMPWLASGDLDGFEPLLTTAWGAVRDAEFFRSVKHFEAVPNAEVTSIDRGAKRIKVRLANGDSFEHEYGKLVIATGASPARLPINIPESPRIQPFHSLADAIHFRKLAQTGQVESAAIVGGGFIGLELAVAIGDLWGISQTVFEREAHVLPFVLDPEMATIAERCLSKEGVTLHTGTSVTAIELDSEGNPVVLADGVEPCPVDYVFLCAGVKPNARLAADCGLQIGSTGAIHVNYRMQTSDPDIYAGGDCVESVNAVTGSSFYIPMGSLANRHGRVIADNLAGNNVHFAGALGAFVIKLFDLNVGAVGASVAAAERAGIEVQAVWGTFQDKPDYMPEHADHTVKLVYERKTQRLIGLQAAGVGEINRRIDSMSAHLRYGASLTDLLGHEHGYAPPYSEALDPLHHLAGLALAQSRGVIVCPPELPDESDTSVQWLDVRTPEEMKAAPLSESVVGIPIEQLEARIGELDAARPVRIICARGPRSYQAVMILTRLGFKDTAFIGGGLHALQ